MAQLKTYQAKRRFGITAEPKGTVTQKRGNAYVVQKHTARRLHYDLRLELDGVMKSWAVTRGPSLVPSEKRLAVQVEDHPFEYNKFEGTIPEGEYGGGTVMIWDRGRWQPADDPRKGLRKGHLTFELDGEKLHGLWHLVRMSRKRGETRNNWLLIKAHDKAAREPGDKDILEQKPRSVVSGRSMDEIAEAAKGKTGSRKKTTARKRARAAISKTAAIRLSAPGRNTKAVVCGVTLSHPDRVYWTDAGVSKRDLAEFYLQIWKWMRPHMVGRPISLLRCPEGASAPCFFQKHAAAGVATEHLHLVPEKGNKIISIDDLAGLISLVQAGVLEIHTRGTTVGDRERADRLVFDLDPGPGTGWKDVVTAAREVRERLARLKLKCFLKTSGGKGLHVVLPTRPTPWDEAKDFAHAVAATMAADAPGRYTASASKSKRNRRIFIDYLRNSREATAIAPYSTRARSGAPVSTPIEWSELGALKSANHYTVLNLPTRLARLRKDPWAAIGRMRQTLPNKY
jgi:bifunctional non-homologous end joining protein LigD